MESAEEPLLARQLNVPTRKVCGAQRLASVVNADIVASLQPQLNARDGRFGPLGLGATGQPRARPFFGGFYSDLYTPWPFSFLTDDAGPDVPLHWWDSHNGWVTRYFTDVELFDWVKQEPGVFRCQATRDCGFHVHPGANERAMCCALCCWTPELVAQAMIDHLFKAHGIRSSLRRKRVWAQDLLACPSSPWLCVEACICPACNWNCAATPIPPSALTAPFLFSMLLP